MKNLALNIFHQHLLLESFYTDENKAVQLIRDYLKVVEEVASQSF